MILKTTVSYVVIHVWNLAKRVRASGVISLMITTHGNTFTLFTTLSKRARKSSVDLSTMFGQDFWIRKLIGCLSELHVI